MKLSAHPDYLAVARYPKALDRGFTLVEMVIAIIALSVLAAIVTPMMLKGVQAYEGTHSSLQTLDKLRYATERMVREIRETNLNNGVFEINMATTPPVTFTKTDGTVVAISFMAMTPDLLNLDYSSTAPVVSGVLTDEYKSSAFTYFDANGVETLSAAAVRYVRITLTLTNPANGKDYVQQTRVAFRDRT